MTPGARRRILSGCLYFAVFLVILAILVWIKNYFFPGGDGTLDTILTAEAVAVSAVTLLLIEKPALSYLQFFFPSTPHSKSEKHGHTHSWSDLLKVFVSLLLSIVIVGSVLAVKSTFISNPQTAVNPSKKN
jgi:hypothetical protein